jgi:protein translocase SecG subunit
MTIIVAMLPYVQIVLSIILIVSILIQQSGTNVGGVLGGGDNDGLYTTRRGFEKFIFIFTIVVCILFAVSAFISIIFK